MSIFDEMGQTRRITETSQALRYFTDRASIIKEFLYRAYSDAPNGKVFYLHADGGVGKSLLLRFLRDYCCRRLATDERETVMGLGDDELIEYLLRTPIRNPIHYAYLNFDAASQGLDQPRESFSALLSLRRQLLPAKMRFPLFELAIAWYLAQTNQFDRHHIKAVIPAEVSSLGAAIVDGLTNSALGSIFVGVMENLAQRSNVDEWLRLRLMQRNLSQTDVEEIRALRADFELFDKLPEFFARDLNIAMAIEETPTHLVLFFDTHEAFWGIERDLSDDLFFKRDEWLRCLIGNISRRLGIDVIIAGRDQLRWPSAPHLHYPIAEKYLEQHDLEYFSRNDAERYLSKVGIPETAQPILIEQATVDADKVLPFYIGLVADIALAAQHRGLDITGEEFLSSFTAEPSGQELVTRLLRYVDRDAENAVRALCAPSSFDEEVFRELGNQLHFTQTHAAFDTITGFSFVQSDGQSDPPQFRIQPLLRKILHDQNDATTARAHAVLQTYYSTVAEADPTALAKAIYHTNHLNWEEGVVRWLQNFRDALQQLDYATCNPLLNVLPELIVKTSLRQAQILMLEGEYNSRLARYESALAAYASALAACERASTEIPTDINALRFELEFCRGDSYIGTGAVQVELSTYEEARTSLRDAIRCYEIAEELKPNDANAINGKGRALSQIAEMDADLSLYTTARESFHDAIGHYDRALTNEPDNKGVRNNKGIVLLRLGKLQRDLAQYDDEITSLNAAISEFQASAEPPNGNLIALSNLGLTLVELADLLVEIGRYREADGHYREALNVFDQPLNNTPTLSQALTNKSLAYFGLAHLHHLLGEYNRARVRYRSAIRLNEAALISTPGHVFVHSNLALAYSGLADTLKETRQIRRSPAML